MLWFVVSCVRSFVRSCVILFALDSFYAVHIRKEEHACSSNTIPYDSVKIANLFTFTYAKIGISSPTRCLRCAIDESA